MNKTIRIVLYVLSILTVAGVIAAAILTGGQAKPASAPGATAEEEQAEMSDAESHSRWGSHSGWKWNIDGWCRNGR